MYLVGEISRQKRIQAGGIIIVPSSPGIPWKRIGKKKCVLFVQLATLHSLKRRQKFLEWTLLLREGQKENYPLRARSHLLKFPTCGIYNSFERRASRQRMLPKGLHTLKATLGKYFPGSPHRGLQLWSMMDQKVTVSSTWHWFWKYERYKIEGVIEFYIMALQAFCVDSGVSAHLMRSWEVTEWNCGGEP